MPTRNAIQHRSSSHCLKTQPVSSERDPIAASRSHRLLSLAWRCAAVVVFILAVNVLFLRNGWIGAIAFSLVPTLVIVDLALVGGLLAVRRPGNAIGSLLLGSGLLLAVSFGAGYYARLDDLMGQGQLPFVVPVAWIGNWILSPAIGLMVVFLPLLYPTGRLPGPRWRILAGVVIVGLSVVTLATATAPGPLDNADWIINPVVLPAPLSDWIATIGAISSLIAPPAFLLAIASVVLRFRASRGLNASSSSGSCSSPRSRPPGWASRSCSWELPPT
jgi:hypothetical protein